MARLKLLAVASLTLAGCSFLFDSQGLERGNRDGGAVDSPYVPAGYVRVFGDEFNEPALNQALWSTRLAFDGGTASALGDGVERYGEQGNHVLDGSLLNLTAYAPNALNSQVYPSGLIRSKTSFQYGYFEARVKMPRGLGVKPSFWLMSAAVANGGVFWPPEIDIFQMVNDGLEDRVDMLNSRVDSDGPQGGQVLYSDPNYHSVYTYWRAPFDFPADFHVISLLWDLDDTATVSVDGKPIVKFAYRWVDDNSAPAPYAEVLLNLAIGGSWAGRHGIDNAAFPQALQVDYVRVYQRESRQAVGADVRGPDLCPQDGGC